MKRRLFAVLIGATLMLSACEVEPKDSKETAAQSTEAVKTLASATKAADKNDGSTKGEKGAEGATKESAVLDSSENVRTTEATEAPTATEAVMTTEAPKYTEPETTVAVKPVDSGEVCPVTVTVGKNVELDLAEGVGQVVRTVVENDGCAFNTKYMHVLKTDEDGNVYRASGKFEELTEEAGYRVCVDALTYGSEAENRLDCPGFIQYAVDTKRSSLKSVSLLERWNGDFTKLDEYLTNENSFLTYNHRIALFKNGKIVTVDELKEKYGEDAADLIDRFGGSLQQYIMSKYDVHQGLVMPYLSMIAADNRDFSKLTERYEAMLKDEAYASYAEEFLKVGACMEVAMIDWGSSDENVQYGSICWDRSSKDDPKLLILVPCTHYEYNLIQHSRKEEEKGDITKFNSMTGGWKFLSYTLPDDFDPDDTLEAQGLIRVFKEEGLILGMTADKGKLSIVMGEPTQGYYDDEVIYFSDRKGDQGEYTIDGDKLIVFDPSLDIRFDFQRMTESELKRFKSMTDEEIEAAIERAATMEDRLYQERHPQ